MATLIIDRTYDDNTILTESQLDAAFDSIETLINVTKLGSDNLQDSSITSDTIAAASVTTSKIATDAVTVAKLADEVTKLLCPTGSVLAYTGTTAPNSEWLMCTGAAVSRTTYSGLFGLFGVAHGEGDGSTTFNLPDYRGRFLRGVDNGMSIDPDVGSRTAMNTGGAVGDNVGSVQSGQFTSHSHGDANHSHTIPNISTFGGPSKGILAYNTTGPDSGSTGLAMGSVYGTNASGALLSAQGGNETRPVNAYVNFIVKT